MSKAEKVRKKVLDYCKENYSTYDPHIIEKGFGDVVEVFLYNQKDFVHPTDHLILHYNMWYDSFEIFNITEK